MFLLGRADEGDGAEAGDGEGAGPAGDGDDDGALDGPGASGIGWCCGDGTGDEHPMRRARLPFARGGGRRCRRMRIIRACFAVAFVVACVVAFFVVDGDHRFLKILFTGPVLVPWVIVEFIVSMRKQGRALDVVAAEHGLVGKFRVVGRDYRGAVDGVDVVVRTDASNAVGKGACLEVVSSVAGLGVGKKAHKRLVKKTAGDGAVEVAWAYPDVVVFADPTWQLVLKRGEVASALHAFVQDGSPNVISVVAGGRVLRASYDALEDEAAVRAFVGDAVALVQLLRRARGG